LALALRADGRKETRDGFDIVIEDIRPFGHHGAECFLVAFEIGNQHFHRASRNQPTDMADRLCEDRRSSVRQLVAVHRGDDGMA
jgi:hypothetical protein